MSLENDGTGATAGAEVEEVIAPELEAPETTEVEAPTEPASIEETIRNTLRGIQARSQPEPPANTAPETPEAKAQRLRDAAGKFATPENAATTAAPAMDGTEAPPVTIDQAIKAPSSWKKGAAEKFATLDPEIQAEVLRREADIHKGVEQYREKAHFGDRMAAAITPHIETLRNMGVAPDRAVAELLASDKALRYGTPEEKLRGIAYLAQSYGINLGALNGQPEQTEAQTHPAIVALQKQVEELTGFQRNQQLMGQQEQAQSLNSEIAKFAADPKNRHFESVRGDMSKLLQAGIATDLASAYEAAIQISPTVRASVLAEQQAAARAEAVKKAQAAKAASSVNTTRRPTMPTTEPIGTMEQTIARKLRELRGG